MKRDYYKQLLTGELIWIYLCKYTLFLAETIHAEATNQVAWRIWSQLKPAMPFFFAPVG